MYPYISILGGRIYIFQLLLFCDFFGCVFFYLQSNKYKTIYFYDSIHAITFSVVFALIGGKLLYAIGAMEKTTYPFICNLLIGGFVFYGGCIGGTIGLYIYCKRQKRIFLEMTDVFFSILPLGQAIGRIGCYLNGCCYGKIQEGGISVPYIVNGVRVRVFPTWFFESAFCLIIFLFFWLVCKTRRLGFYTAVYMILYSSFRFIIEFFRGDEIRGVWGSFSTSQVISIAVFFGGMIVAINNCRKNKNIQNDMLREKKERRKI